MTEFYGDAAPVTETDPADDPVLTVRIQPPDTQARRLDLATRRAVKVGPDAWAIVTPTSFPVIISDQMVVTWPVVSAISIGAAQRLASEQIDERAAGGHLRESDEDERLFR